MKQYSAFAAFLMFAMLSIQSCKKDKIVDDYPGLVITSPVNNQMYTSGATVHITGTATASATDDSHLLHEVELTVYHLPDSAVVFNAIISTHDMESYVIDTSYISGTGASSDHVLKATVMNHLDKTTNVFVPFMAY